LTLTLTLTLYPVPCRLRKERDELENRLRKFTLVPDRPPLVKVRGAKAKGAINLRALMDEIGRVRKRLCVYDPTVLLC